jgi:hypothetical protein
MRTLTPAVIAELKAGSFRPFILLEAKFKSGMIHVWSGYGNLVWNSLTWNGVGYLGSISGISETSSVQANGIKIGLSGIPSDTIGKALNECRQGNPVKLWLGFMTESRAVIADPAQSFAGRMDTVAIDEGAETSTITIAVESRLIDLQRPRIRRYTDDDQQRTSPGDKGFEFVNLVQEWNGSWGKRRFG